MSKEIMNRVTALDFGQCFMIWTFSKGHAQSGKVKGYAKLLGISSRQFSGAVSDRPDSKLLEEIHKQLGRINPALDHWFEIGWKYLFLSNMCKFPPDEAMLADALSGFRGALELGEVSIADRDELESGLLGLKSADDVAAEKKLKRSLEKLRSIATSLDQRDKHHRASSDTRKTGFLQRNWTDAEKWGMGIIAALIVAGLLTLFSLNSPS